MKESRRGNREPPSDARAMHEAATRTQKALKKVGQLIGMASIFKNGEVRVVAAQRGNIENPLRIAMAPRFVERIDDSVAKRHTRIADEHKLVAADLTLQQASRRLRGYPASAQLAKGIGQGVRFHTTLGIREGILVGVRQAGAKSTPSVYLMNPITRHITEFPAHASSMEPIGREIYHNIARKRVLERELAKQQAEIYRRAVRRRKAT